MINIISSADRSVPELTNKGIIYLLLYKEGVDSIFVTYIPGYQSLSGANVDGFGKAYM